MRWVEGGGERAGGWKGVGGGGEGWGGGAGGGGGGAGGICAGYLECEEARVLLVHEEDGEGGRDAEEEREEQHDAPPPRIHQGISSEDDERREGGHEDGHRDDRRRRRPVVRQPLQHRHRGEGGAQPADVVVALRLSDDAASLVRLDGRVVVVVGRRLLRPQLEGAVGGRLVAEDEHRSGDDGEAHEGADGEELDEHVDVNEQRRDAAGGARRHDGHQRRLVLRVDVGEPAEAQPVGGHRVDGARHGEQAADQRRADAEQRADGDDHLRPVQAAPRERRRERRRHVDLGVGHEQGQGCRRAEVEHRRYGDRQPGGDRDRLLRSFRLLARHGDALEADVGVEAGGGSGEHTGEAEREEAARVAVAACRQRPVGAVAEREPDGDDEDDDDKVDEGEHVVDVRRRFGAARDEHHDGQHDAERHHIRVLAEALHAHVSQVRQRSVLQHAAEHRVQCAAPGARHRRDAKHVFQHDVPADHEGAQLADRHVRVRVRRAGLRYARPELGVAERRQHGRHAGEQVRQDGAGSGHVAHHGAGQHEQPGAHHVPDTEQGQVERVEAAAQRRLHHVVLQRLFARHVTHHPSGERHLRSQNFRREVSRVLAPSSRARAVSLRRRRWRRHARGATNNLRNTIILPVLCCGAIRIAVLQWRRRNNRLYACAILTDRMFIQVGAASTRWRF